MMEIDRGRLDTYSNVSAHGWMHLQACDVAVFQLAENAIVPQSCRALK
jgi:hypothetical protein